MALPQRQIYTEDDYYNLPESVRAELIDGQIYYQAAPGRIHQEILGALYYEIRDYINSKGDSCKVYPAPFAVKLNKDSKNILEPDISVICDKDKLDDRGCNGPPDWIIEIVSPGNPGHDYVLKLNKYMAAGVREYWIVNPMKQMVYVYSFKDKTFDTSPFTFQDKIKASIYEDLTIDFSQLDL